MADVLPVEPLPRHERPRRVGVDRLPTLEGRAPVVVGALTRVQPLTEPAVQVPDITIINIIYV